MNSPQGNHLHIMIILPPPYNQPHLITHTTHNVHTHTHKPSMFSSFVVFICVISIVLAESPWMDKSKTSAERVDFLMKEMRMTEKLDMLHGYPATGYVGYTVGNERLKIPALTLNDGPQGYRCNDYVGTSTSFPGGATIGSTWDRKLAKLWGKAMGKEFFDKGSNVQLGPGVNLARVPQNGRNFEYISGADPFLGYEMSGAAVKGIQSQNVIANAKHYINNNQETNRNKISERVDERTRHELYYRPFAGAIDANVGSFMCSYNLINDIYACENDETLNTDLRGHLGFEHGWVMSDWGATHSTSIKEGLDQEMPGDVFFGNTLLEMTKNGTISQETIDKSVKRILTPMFRMGLFDVVNTNKDSNIVTSSEHNDITRNLASAAQIY